MTSDRPQKPARSHDWLRVSAPRWLRDAAHLGPGDAWAVMHGDRLRLQIEDQAGTRTVDMTGQRGSRSPELEARVASLEGAIGWLTAVRDQRVAPAPSEHLRARAALIALIEQLRRSDGGDAHEVAHAGARLGEIRAALGPDSADDSELTCVLALVGLALGDVAGALAAHAALPRDLRLRADGEPVAAGVLAILADSLLGRGGAARARLDESAASFEGVGLDAVGAAHAERLARLADCVHVPRLALRCWQAAAARADGSLQREHWRHTAIAAQRCGDHGLAAEALGRAAVGADAGALLRLARLSCALGAFTRADALLDAAELIDRQGRYGRDAALLRAELALWRGQWVDAEAAIAWLSGDDLGAAYVRGVAAVGQGDCARGIRCLDRVIAAGERRQEARLARAEASLWLRRWADVRRDLRAAEQIGTTLMASVLLVLMYKELGWRLRRRLDRRYPADGFLSERLPAICRMASLPVPASEAHVDVQLMRRVLSKLGGNRTSRSTVVDPDGRLSYLDAEGGRAAATRTLLRVRVAPLAEVLSGFEDTIAAYPASPHPFTYRGELRLWLGDIDGALADFARATALKPCRWAAVGTSAAWMLRGDLPRSMFYDIVGRLQFPALRSATTYVYRGELSRRRGRLDAARADLTIATEAKPGRVAAWLNLAMTLRSLGAFDACADACAQVEARAPAILWEASHAAGFARTTRLPIEQLEPIAEAALSLMRGNRSSIVYTLFVDDELRVVPDPKPIIACARALLATLLPGVRTALVRETMRPFLDDSPGLLQGA